MSGKSQQSEANGINNQQQLTFSSAATVSSTNDTSSASMICSLRTVRCNARSLAANRGSVAKIGPPSSSPSTGSFKNVFAPESFFPFGNRAFLIALRSNDLEMVNYAFIALVTNSNYKSPEPAKDYAYFEKQSIRMIPWWIAFVQQVF